MTVPDPNLHPRPRELDEWSETDVWKGGLERANRRIAGLTETVHRLEQSIQNRLDKISSLQSLLTRLKDENLHFNRHLAELTRENEALRINDTQKSGQIGALVRGTNRIQNNLFWTVCHFIAGSNEFESYANSVGYDLTRLFCMLLAAEIREASDLAPEIKAHAAVVANIFDPFFYLTEYQDIALDGVNPLLHYVTHGHQEGRNPSHLFDCAYYKGNARLKSGDPLLHYLQKGAQSGLRPHPLFDTQYYWDQYPDVAKLKLNPLFHYQTWGGRERRNPSVLFDTEYFLESRGVSTPVENPLREYLTGVASKSVDPHPLFLSTYFCQHAGIAEPDEVPLVLYEKRSDLNKKIQPHPLFDLAFMQERLGIRFEEGMSPLESFCRMSRQRDIDPSSLFDSALYRYQVEVEKGSVLHEAPILDYLKRGHRDKILLPNVAFDPKTYIERNNIDVAGPELTHYCLVGDRSGFYTHPLFCAEIYNAKRKDSPKLTALEHFLQSTPAKARVSHPNTGRPLSHDVVDFIRSACADKAEFDPHFYRRLYPDLAKLTVTAAKKHYDEHGKLEGRVGSPRVLIQKNNILLRDLPLGFFADEYLDLNPDLAQAGLPNDFLVLFYHYLRYGRAEKRSIGKWQLHLDALDLRIPTPASPMSVNVDNSRTTIGVLLHLFYTDLWPELAAFARNFESVSRDVFVNVVDIAWTPAFHGEVRELCPGAFVQLSNDSGRDIGGFMRLLDNVDIGKYDYFAWMHSKKSPHLAPERGDYWRRSLLSAFAGNQKIVSNCIQLFRDDPSIGLVGAKEWRTSELGRNEEQFQRILNLFEIDEHQQIVEYPSGTMFLIRSDIVQRMYDRLKLVDWEYGADKDLAFHVDGQIAHAVERVIGNLVRHMGYRIAWR